MNELSVIGSLFIRKEFWDRQGENIASRCNKMYGENLFQRPKNDFGERSTQPRSQGPLSSFLEKVPAGHVSLYTNPHRGWVFDLILSKVETFLSRAGRNCVCLFKMALTFLSRLQVALLSVGYTDIILKVKQVICLEAMYLKKRSSGSASNRIRKIASFSRFAAIVEGRGYYTHFSKYDL